MLMGTRVSSSIFGMNAEKTQPSGETEMCVCQHLHLVVIIRESAHEKARKCSRKAGNTHSISVLFKYFLSFLTCCFTGSHFNMRFSFAINACARNVNSLETKEIKCAFNGFDCTVIFVRL